MKNQWKLIVSIIILILVVIFALQNTNVVTVDVFVAKFNTPLVLVMLLSLLVGVIVGLAGSSSALFAQKRENSIIQKELKQLKESNLRDHADKDSELARLRQQVKDLKQVKENTLTVPSQTEDEVTL